MLRLTNKFRTLKLSVDAVNSNYQTVRWRKPRWVPVAKSKMFRIPQKVQVPLDEKYFFYKHNLLLQKSADPEEQRRIYEEDFARCKEINDKWNAEQAVQREQRLQQNLQENIEFAQKRIEEEQLLQQKKRELVEEIVRKEKAEAKTFITPENIDDAIEQALNNVVDYNFAINTDGSKIIGRETRPEKEVKEKARLSR